MKMSRQMSKQRSRQSSIVRRLCSYAAGSGAVSGSAVEVTTGPLVANLAMHSAPSKVKLHASICPFSP